MKQPYVYIMASKRNGTLYVGVTSNIIQRVWQHKNGTTPGFASIHHCTDLVYAEPHPDMITAITREKQIKSWSRARKLTLIETANHQWNDTPPA